MISKTTVENVALLEKPSSLRASITKEIDVDEYLEYVGPSGRFQKLLVLIFCGIIVPLTFQVLIMSFVGSNPSWRCNRQQNITNISSLECKIQGEISPSHAKYEDRCTMNRSSWKFTKPKDYSIVTQWELICDRKYLSHIANSAMFIGWAFGAVLLGFVSDRFGRKMTLFPSWTVLVLASFLSGFANSIGMFIFLRVVIGFSQGGIGLFIMATELVGPKYRSLSGSTLWFAFSSALCLMALQAWLVQRWQTLEIITSIPYIVLLATYRFVPESVRWLRVNNKLKEATEVLHRVARFNKVAVVGDVTLSAPPKTTSSSSFFDLFKTSQMTISILIQCFAWFANGQVYYGISLASDQLGGDMYRDFVLTSIVEIPANIMVIDFTNRYGRKPTVSYSMLASGISCIAVAFIPTNEVYFRALRVTLGMFGKLFISLSFNSLYLWTVELLPTTVRSRGAAFLTLVSRIGAASSPWVAQYMRTVHNILPFTIMGGLTIASGLLCFKLKETNGIATVETIDQIMTDSRTDKDKDSQVGMTGKNGTEPIFSGEQKSQN